MGWSLGILCLAALFTWRYKMRVIWATLPAENKIARLSVAAPGVYSVLTSELPTQNSHPYDIAYAAGSVWVSEYAGNKIAHFDLDAEKWTAECEIQTLNSHPTGLTTRDALATYVGFNRQDG